MPSIALGQASYKRAGQTPLITRNLVFEQTPTNTEDQTSLISRPALRDFIDNAEGSFRGLLRQDGALGGLIFFIVGDTLYKSTQDGLTITEVGEIPGALRCVMAGSGSYILIATGAALYSTDGNTVSAVAFPDDANVSSVAVLNSYFLALRAGTQRVYFSAVGGITFDPLDYFSAETQPDDLVNIGVFGDELWMFGQSSIEVHVPSGDADAPFLRVNGRMFTMGCAARDSVAKMDDGLAWVGQDRIVYHTGAAPVRISSETIEQALSQWPDADLTQWSYTVEGKMVLVLNIGAHVSYAFCNGKWSQFDRYGFDYLPAWSSARLTNGQYVVGSLIDNMIYKLDQDSTYDADDTLAMICDFTGLVDITTAPLRCDSIILDCVVGIGTPEPWTDNPQVQMAISNDRGKTFQSWISAPFGRMGAFWQQVFWMGGLQTGGLMRRPGRVFWWRCQPPSRFVVRRAKINESIH